MSEFSRRQLYRIVYPLSERPTFEVGRFVFEVVDCSERGLRYEVKDRRVPAVGTELAGRLSFRRGDDIDVAGEVIRAREGIVVLALDPPIPFADIMAEQRYLRMRGYLPRE